MRQPSQKDYDENFLLSDLRRRNNEKPPIILQSVHVQGKIIDIIGVISESLEDHIQFQSRCPRDLNVIPVYPTFINVSINNYFALCRMQYYYISLHSEINEQILINSLKYLISDHFERHKRLVDTDLFEYIDYTVFCYYELWYAFFNHTPSDEDVELIWRTLHKISFTVYKNFIYVTKYDLSSPLDPKPFLVKLDDNNKFS